LLYFTSGSNSCQSRTYYDAIKIGCCATSGVDFSRLADAPLVLPSYRIGEAFSNDYSKFIVMSAGAALPVWYNHYGGSNINVLNDESRVRQVMYSRNGIPFDVAITRSTDADCDAVHVKVALAWDLFNAGTTLFENSDRLDGVNFINKFDVVNP
jgi:hypothetical protein